MTSLQLLEKPSSGTSEELVNEKYDVPNFEAWNRALSRAGLPSFTPPNASQYDKYCMVDSVGLMMTPNIMGSVGEVLGNWDEISRRFSANGIEKLHTYVESKDASFRIRQKNYSLDELKAVLQKCLARENGDALLVSAIPAGEVLYNGTAIVGPDGNLLAEFSQGKRTPARGAPIAFSLKENHFLGPRFPTTDTQNPQERGIALTLLRSLPKTELHDSTYETYLPGYYEFGVVQMPGGSIKLSFYDYNKDPRWITL